MNTVFESQLTSIVLAASLFILFTVEIVRNSPSGSVNRLSTTLLSVFVICWPFSHMLLIRDMRPFGDKYTYFLFMLIWLIDTGAYAAGSKFGRHKLADKISPKKTVEGVIGAIVAGLVFGPILWKCLKITTFTFKETLMFSLVITVMTIVSDLAESLIKRDANIKDSDNLLPGHGGMLDRFDSFIFTAPVFYYLLIILRK
jgi:phosphatidate cytidylyltransferase